MKYMQEEIREALAFIGDLLDSAICNEAEFDEDYEIHAKAIEEGKHYGVARYALQQLLSK